MRLEMRSQNAYIGIKQNSASQTIKQPNAEIQIETKQAKVKIESTLPKVKIDQRQAFSESGLKGVLELSTDNANEALDKMDENVAKVVQEGNQMADIRSGANAIAEIAYNNSISKSMHEFNMVTMPKSGAKIDVEEGVTDIQVEGGTVDIRFKTSNPIIEYNAGKVETYIRQKNKLDITVVKDRFDMKV